MPLADAADPSHPLAILNISDHYTRDKCTSEPGSKSKRESNVPQTLLTAVLGAILGTQNGREVSIQNSFELVHVTDETGNVKVNEEFLITRREQCECPGADRKESRQSDGC